MTCRYEGCPNPASVAQSRCAEHRLRWLPGKPVEQPLPEWLRRARANRLPAKDLTGSAA